jgi:hypothetical protein
MGGEEQGPPETVFKQALSRMLELLDRKDVLNSVFMQVLKEQSERNPLLRCLGSALQCPLLPGPGSRLPADRTADRGPRTADRPVPADLLLDRFYHEYCVDPFTRMFPLGGATCHFRTRSAGGW